ncbi:MAG: WXG100 family type VII secretion target [Chloroflexi bacterium]|nr:WXG100 family type VII secretion target [Ktedonobacteraceae bacterium]MBV9707459.1 WXG100 family type VII secretion target [Chloroflexota bacterium]
MPAPFLHGSRPPESLSQEIQDLANQFANVSGVLSEQYDTLNRATNGLLDGTFPWKGKGATAFFDSWQVFGKYMEQLQKSCEDTHTSLSKLSGKIADAESQQAWDILLAITGGILTIISFAAMISELGLNPLVDGFFAWAGSFTEQEGAGVVNISEEITQADSQAATELQAIEDDLTTSPALAGSSGDFNVIPEAISPTNLDNMILNVAGDNGQSEFFQLDLNSGEPGSTIDEVGQKYLDELKQAGVSIDDAPDTQQYLKMRGARGVTWNDNLSTDSNAGAHGVTILLGNNANNATVYEEYLHFQELKANNWVGPSPGSAEYYMEEIKVERQVLANATMLKMTPTEQAELRQILQGYIDDLYAKYGIQM